MPRSWKHLDKLDKNLRRTRHRPPVMVIQRYTDRLCHGIQLKRFNCRQQDSRQRHGICDGKIKRQSMRSQFLRMNPVSNSALCATMTVPSQNFMNSGRISSIWASAHVILDGRQLLNIIRDRHLRIDEGRKRSVIAPSTTLTAPISMILFLSGESPVVPDQIRHSCHLSSVLLSQR